MIDLDALANAARWVLILIGCMIYTGLVYRAGLATDAHYVLEARQQVRDCEVATMGFVDEANRLYMDASYALNLLLEADSVVDLEWFRRLHTPLAVTEDGS